MSALQLKEKKTNLNNFDLNCLRESSTSLNQPHDWTDKTAGKLMHNIKVYQPFRPHHTKNLFLKGTFYHWAYNQLKN